MQNLFLTREPSWLRPENSATPKSGINRKYHTTPPLDTKKPVYNDIIHSNLTSLPAAEYPSLPLNARITSVHTPTTITEPPVLQSDTSSGTLQNSQQQTKSERVRQHLSEQMLSIRRVQLSSIRSELALFQRNANELRTRHAIIGPPNMFPSGTYKPRYSHVPPAVLEAFTIRTGAIRAEADAKAAKNDYPGAKADYDRFEQECKEFDSKWLNKPATTPDAHTQATSPDNVEVAAPHVEAPVIDPVVSTALTVRSTNHKEPERTFTIFPNADKNSAITIKIKSSKLDNLLHALQNDLLKGFSPHLGQRVATLPADLALAEAYKALMSNIRSTQTPQLTDSPKIKVIEDKSVPVDPSKPTTEQAIDISIPPPLPPAPTPQRSCIRSLNKVLEKNLGSKEEVEQLTEYLKKELAKASSSYQATQILHVKLGTHSNETQFAAKILLTARKVEQYQKESNKEEEMRWRGTLKYLREGIRNDWLSFGCSFVGGSNIRAPGTASPKINLPELTKIIEILEKN